MEHKVLQSAPDLMAPGSLWVFFPAGRADLGSSSSLVSQEQLQGEAPFPPLLRGGSCIPTPTHSSYLQGNHFTLPHKRAAIRAVQGRAGPELVPGTALPGLALSPVPVAQPAWVSQLLRKVSSDVLAHTRAGVWQESQGLNHQLSQDH